MKKGWFMLTIEGEKMGNKSEIVIYQTEDGMTKIDVRLEDETVWLTQAEMVELFQSSKSNISEHIKHIFEEGELEEKSVVRKIRTTASDGKSYNTTFYSLDVIISVGYRVKSLRGTQFRIWANSVLKEYIKKGFALNDERLKELGGGSYWKELLDRIRDIRSSEKVLYRQVLDLYATSIDYDPKSEESITFFKMVQNKFHYATHGNTAAEVIYNRADAEKEFMGLTSFASNFPTKKDVAIAKNYLSESELKVLNNLVSAYFDLAEINAIEHKKMYMKDYIKQLDTMIAGTGKPLLDNSGRISHKQAIAKAEKEYQKFIQNNLSPVEEAYLETIKGIEKEAKNHQKKKQ